ncbi:MAG: 30S ribosomal protein S16 [Alphaproteobacteria bacterium]|nr:30S ribosomal protein S16 [Alphaproteobacteria bacterium]
MALKMRLARAGAKKRPYYRIVVTDARNPRDGRFIEKVGTYNPMVERDHADRIRLVEDRVRHWLACGAQPTDRVARFLGDKGITPKPEYRNDPQQSAPKKRAQERLKEKAEKAAAAAEASE